MRRYLLATAPRRIRFLRFGFELFMTEASDCKANIGRPAILAVPASSLLSFRLMLAARHYFGRRYFFLSLHISDEAGRHAHASLPG